MKRYDIIIIGAGIAGCALACKLTEKCPEKSVLIIEKSEIGSNVGYGHRLIQKNLLDKYDIDFLKKFNGLKIETPDFELKIPHEYYSVNYKDLCNYFISRSETVFQKELAKDVKDNILITDKGKYGFRFLIDCSGSSFFLRKIRGLPLPFLYFIGKLHVMNIQPKFTDNYFYFHGNPQGYVEDIYFYNDRIIHGDWWISNNINFNKITRQEYDLMKRFKINRDLIDDETRVCYPISPMYPISTEKYAFLGDSFGCSSAAGGGIPAIINASEILTECINDNDLANFQKIWKKKYMDIYQKHLAGKMHLKDRFFILDILKDHPDLVNQVLFSEKIRIPGWLIWKIPKIIILKELYYRIKLKIKYWVMENRFRYI